MGEFIVHLGPFEPFISAPPQCLKCKALDGSALTCVGRCSFSFQFSAPPGLVLRSGPFEDIVVKKSSVLIYLRFSAKTQQHESVNKISVLKFKVALHFTDPQMSWSLGG